MLAVFDALVAITALLAAVNARKNDARDALTQTGYFSIALAATIGTFKYLGYAEFAEEHRIASFIASVVGVPFAAFGFFFSSARLRLGSVMLVAAVVVALAVVFFGSAKYALLAGIAAQLVWLRGGWLHRHFPGHILFRVTASVVLTAAAGLLFAGQGQWLGVRKENIFHGLLSLALWQQAYAFHYVNFKRAPTG